MARIVSYFSHGVPSLVATKLAYQAEWPAGYDDFVVYNFEIKQEHPDNARFRVDAQEWLGHNLPIITIGNDDFDRSTDEVYRQTRFLVGPRGARCTTELKKAMRHSVAKPDDIVVLGYTLGEKHRVEQLLASEPLLKIWPILIDRNLDRSDVMALFARTGIELPAMYRLGYKNNNCIGCVKGQAGYWNKIRIDFPERFAEMAAIERELNRTICKREWTDANGDRQIERIFLDEMPPDLGVYEDEPEHQCGIFCHMAELDLVEKAAA